MSSYFYGTPSTTVLEYCITPVLRTLINHVYLLSPRWLDVLLHSQSPATRGRYYRISTYFSLFEEHNGVCEYDITGYDEFYTSIPVFSTTGMSLFRLLDCTVC
jgi:hypothetical protein